MPRMTPADPARGGEGGGPSPGAGGWCGRSTASHGPKAGLAGEGEAEPSSFPSNKEKPGRHGRQPFLGRTGIVIRLGGHPMRGSVL